ncbi:MAG: hypothetical protein R2941_01845 [Desulfobacterales bacterium]
MTLSSGLTRYQRGVQKPASFYVTATNCKNDKKLWFLQFVSFAADLNQVKQMAAVFLYKIEVLLAKWL